MNWILVGAIGVIVVTAGLRRLLYAPEERLITDYVGNVGVALILYALAQVVIHTLQMP